ncbi:MAG TPA: hypothetical protein VF194_16050 [Ferrovibrio sp.]|jgi:hypothetical protein|uniref:hypothetical protein n=1 Tax=Ferrovibrio sp. TaxID=1917215 RepID=UPI002ED55C1C
MAKFTVDDIVPGQRFEQRQGFVWRVIRLISFPGEDMMHVQLVNDRDHSTTKTVSVNALLDRNLFRLMEK